MLTDEVLSEIERAPNPRFREIMSAAPDATLRGPWFSRQHSFVIEEGVSALPPPVTAKATGDRPSLVILDPVLSRRQ